MTFVKELVERTQYLKRDYFMNAMNSREKLFLIAGSTALRGCLSVAVFHLMFWSWAWSSVNVPPGFEHYVAADVRFPSAAPFTWFGWVGVEIFFVISGFVIANSASKSSATEFPRPGTQTLSGGLGLLHLDLPCSAFLCAWESIRIHFPLHTGDAAHSQGNQRSMA